MFKISGRICYPEYVLNKITKNYPDEWFVRNGKKRRQKRVTFLISNCHIGKLSATFKIKLHIIAQKYCTDLNVSRKDKLVLKSMAVYKFDFSRCNSCSVGYTTFHCHIQKQLQELLECKKTSNTIIDVANTEYEQ